MIDMLQSVDFYKKKGQKAFSLVEMSVVLAILAVILAGVMPFLLESTKSKDSDKTVTRMDDIESALQAFYARNNRLPCPADATLAVNTANFGVEANNTGTCTGGGIQANFADTVNGTVGGAVPTKTLNLPDEAAFDGWGRRFNYHVTTTATAASATGVIIVRDHAAANRTTQAIYVLFSSGASGHGAFTVGGTRLNGGITAGNTEKLQNCDCTAAAANGTYDNIFIQGMEYPSTNMAILFDDVVRYMTEEQLQQKAYASAAGPTSCPSGFTLVGTAGRANSLCIETNERAATDFFTAADTCHGINNSRGRAMLCSPIDWYYACRVGAGLANLTNGREWTDQVIPGGTDNVITPGNGSCSVFDQADRTTSVAYRCCQH